MKKVGYSDEENEEITKFVSERINTRISREDVEVLCIILNDKFHQQEPIRTHRRIMKKIYATKKRMLFDAKVRRVPEESETNTKIPEHRERPTKRYSKPSTTIMKKHEI